MDKQLDVLAHNILIKRLKDYGNEPNEAQKHSLFNLCHSYYRMAIGQLRGWYAFGMPVGCGKTLSIIALCMALTLMPTYYQQGLAESGHEDVSILVCASKVEALCQLKRDLVANGVPEEWIGLYHSYEHNPDKVGQGNYASEPATGDHENRRILLTTHQRVREKRTQTDYQLYKGKPRSLVIYDESLVKAEAMAVKVSDIKVATAHHKALIEVNNWKKTIEVVKYLERVLQLVDKELNEQFTQNRMPGLIYLPRLEDKEITQFKTTLDKRYYLSRSIEDLLDLSQEPLRVLQTHQGDGFITYEMRVDEHLENMIILDASYVIRDLVKRYDNRITELPGDSFTVDYGDLELLQLRFPGGRTTMEKVFSKNVKGRVLSREIAHVIKQIPKGEGLLILTYKYRGNGPDIPKILKRDLKRYGVDLNAIVEIRDSNGKKVKKPRINFLTWGQETSLNDYAWCKNQIQVGTLHRSHLEIGGLITGQVGDLLMRIHRDEIHGVVKSEVRHCFYQAIGRSHLRVVRDGHAGAAKVWFIDQRNDIKEGLIDAGILQNAQWKEWIPRYMEEQKSKTRELAHRITQFLNDLSEKTLKISTSALRNKMELNGQARQTVQRAIRYAVENHADWDLKGRSLVKVI